MPGLQEEKVASQLEETRSRLAREDFVHRSTRPRPVLKELLEADPSNSMALQYLLCYDMVTLDLDAFVEDYPEGVPATSVYQEALLIWLSLHDRLDEATLSRYGMDAGAMDRMERFFQNPDRYRNTYWYYFMDATQDE